MGLPQAPIHIVIAGGGTGGHISPAVAVATELRSRGPVTLHWIGSHAGFERDAAHENDIPFSAVRTGKLRRYFARETLGDAFRVPAGIVEARRILKQLRPDVVFSTGGFVSTPTVIAARSLGIPSLTHEQTASLGLATRINSRFSDVVALSFPLAESVRSRRKSRVIVTGNPVRPGILNGSPETLTSLYGAPEHLPLVYVTGGAQGAHALNEAIRESLPSVLDGVALIHQCGPQSGNGDFTRLMESRDNLPPDMQSRYIPVERVGDELAHIYAASSIVIGRAGAGTVAELATLGIPSILVPLPGAEEQLRNAQVLESVGGAVILDQSSLTPQSLQETLAELLADPDRLESMGAAVRNVVSGQPAASIADELVALAVRN